MPCSPGQGSQEAPSRDGDDRARFCRPLHDYDEWLGTVGGDLELHHVLSGLLRCRNLHDGSGVADNSNRRLALITWASPSAVGRASGGGPGG